MITIRHAPCALLLSICVAPAFAGEFAARDMGATWRSADCMEAARRALGEFAQTFGGAPVTESSWAVAAASLGPGEQDAVITCTFGPGGKTRGTLVVHSARPDIRRVKVADGLERLWRHYADRFETAARSRIGG